MRFYADIGTKEYNEKQKETLVKTLIEISKNLYPSSQFVFDIAGSGYGISKGTALSSLKTFYKRIEQKGFSRMKGMSVFHCVDNDYRPVCNIAFINRDNTPYISIDFFWEYSKSYDCEKALYIVNNLINIIHINYVYGFVCKENLMSQEGITRKGLFGSVAYIPNEIQAWDKQIVDIPNGVYRKLFDFNVFNTKQIENIASNTAFIKSTLNNELQIWIKKENDNI